MDKTYLLQSLVILKRFS